MSSLSSVLSDMIIPVTSIGDGLEVLLVDKRDDQEDEHNCCWVVAYLQEDSMHTVVDLREHIQKSSQLGWKEQIWSKKI